MALFRRMSPSVAQGVDPFAGDDAHHGLTFFIAVIAEGVIIGGAVAWYIWGRGAITIPPPKKVQTVQLRKHPKKPPPPKPPPPPPPPKATVKPTNVPIPLEPMPPLPYGAAFIPAPPAAPPGPPSAPVGPPAPPVAQMTASFSSAVGEALYLCAQGHYPPQALMAGLGGTATVAFVYSNQRATHVKLRQSTGHFSLDRAIMRAVRTCPLPAAPAGVTKRSFLVQIEMKPGNG